MKRVVLFPIYSDLSEISDLKAKYQMQVSSLEEAATNYRNSLEKELRLIKMDFASEKETD